MTSLVYRTIASTLLSFFLALPTVADQAKPVLDAEAAIPVFQMERYYSAPQSQKDDPPLRVGDIIRFRWVGEKKPPSTAVEVVAQEDGKSLSSLGWEVYSQPKDDPSSAFSLIPLRPGSLELPPLAVRDPSKKVLGVTPVLKFEVAPAASQEEMKDKPPEFLPPLAMKLPGLWVAIYLLLIFGVIAAALAIAWRLTRRFRKSRQLVSTAAATIRRSEDDEALQSLERLEKDRLWLEQRFKPHYFGVSEALKRYIERRYGFDAAESTTRELLAGLSEKGLDALRLQSLSELFVKLDRVKFTDFTPDQQECLWVLSEARSWVTATRRITPQSGGVDAV